MKHPHGKVINYNQLKYLPSRIDFLDTGDKKEVDLKIRTDEPLMFMPNDIKETHLQDVKYGKSSYKICVYGVLKDGRKAVVILDGIKPYFDIWLKDQSKKGSKAEAVNILTELLEGRDTEPDSEKDYEIIEARPFMGYREDPVKMMRIFFKKSKIKFIA